MQPIRENCHKLFPLPAEPSLSRNQAWKQQSRNQKEFSAASQSDNGCFHVASNGPLQAFSLFTQTEPPNSLPLSCSCSARGGNVGLSCNLQDLTKLDGGVSADSNVKPDGLIPDMTRHVCLLNCRKTEISHDLARSNLIAAFGGSKPVVSAPPVAPEPTEQRTLDGMLLHEAQLGCALVCDRDNHRERDQGCCDAKKLENLEAFDANNLGNILKGDALTNRCNKSTKISIEHGIGQNPDSLKLEGKDELHAGRLTSTVAEKLWEGTIQLNSSATVSVVAYFKSGERLSNINWTKFIEVKGQVKLVAFEKYIQDLPRSRNRGLMVVSLCWKNGSSEAGRVGMKEVGKKFQEREKVGLAQLSAGVDLYICPRSDPIITILAKYGFFKGMAAIEDNQNSLIGCVVWRKNRSLNADVSSSKPDSSSPIEPSVQNPFPKENAGLQKPVASHVDDSSSKPSTPASDPSSPSQQAAGSNFPVAGSVLSHGSAVTKLVLAVNDDDGDDLPEFDFGIGHKASQTPTSNSLEAPNRVKRPAAERFQKMDASFPGLLPRHVVDANLETPPSKRVCEFESWFPPPKWDGARMAFGSLAAGRKNIFDNDDDDVPEWEPPGVGTAKSSSGNLGYSGSLSVASSTVTHPWEFPVRSDLSVQSNSSSSWRPPPKQSDTKLSFHSSTWNHWKPF